MTAGWSGPASAAQVSQRSKGNVGDKLSLKDNEFYRRCDEILHYLWDPTGICEEPAARDEYHSYLPRVFSLVKDGAAEGAVVDYLTEVEQHMGLTNEPGRAREVARLLIDSRKWIYGHAS